MKRGYLYILPVFLGIVVCRTFEPSAYNESFRYAEAVEVCFAHDKKMRWESVPILYGFVIDSDGPSPRTQILQFPFATWEVLGGCVLEVDGPYDSKVLICASCEDAKLRWLRLHEDAEWSVRQLKLYRRMKKPNLPPQTTSGRDATGRV